jgi:tetratricopeptide (TPR) repeat protein
VDTAVKYFQRALEIEPDNPEARYNLGLAFAEAGLVLEAIREWRGVVEADLDEETTSRAKLSIERVEHIMTE